MKRDPIFARRKYLCSKAYANAYAGARMQARACLNTSCALAHFMR
jgi:hypothetical protein